MKKYLGFIVFLLIFSQNIFTNEEENTIKIEGKNKPAKMKIGVHKLKTEELTLDFNLKDKIIYGEIPNYNNELVFVSENLDAIPSVKTVGGKRIVNKIKKMQLNEAVKEKNITYEVIKNLNESKTYIKISPNVPLKDVYVYLLDSGNYKIKKVYRGKFIKTLADEKGPCPESHSKFATVEFSPYRNAAIKLGKYIVRGQNEVVDSTGLKASYITTSGDLPKRIYPGDGDGHTWKDFDPTWNAVRIYLGTPAEAGINFWTSDYYVKNGGSFTSHVSIPNINANIRFYADSTSPYINFSIEGWEGEINQLFTIEYRRTYDSTEESDVIHRDYFTLKMPPRTIRKTIDINIESPIVQYRNEQGYAESGLDGVKTYGKNGSVFLKNDPWITVVNPVEYWGSDLKDHEVTVYDGRKTDKISTLANGEFQKGYSGSFDEADVMLSYKGGTNKKTVLGVSRHNFNKMTNKDLVVTHYYPKDNPSKEPAYVFTYRFNIAKFDGRKYYDDIKADIKLDKATVVDYKPGDGGVINFGTIVLKDLDTKIVAQSGGEGIKIGGVKEVFLKKVNDPIYPLIPAKLYFKSNNNPNNQIDSVLEGIDQREIQDEVYITFDKIAEEKLIVGGIFEVVDKFGESPLKIGTSIYGNNTGYYSSFGKLQVNAENRYIETTVSINNPDFPIEGPKGWLRFNASNYLNGDVSGHPGISWGSVTNPVDIPANASLEIFTKDWKSLGKNIITKLSVGVNSAINLAYKKGDRFISLGYKTEEYALKGAEETYYLRFTTDDGRLLFTNKFNIHYGKPISVNNSTIIEILNPINSSMGSLNGAIFFNGSSWSEGQASGTSNSEIINYYGNKTQWFKVVGGVDYRLNDGDIIYVYDRDGTEYGTLDKFSEIKKPLKIKDKTGKEIFYVYYSPRDSAIGISFNGAVYNGTSLTKKLYLRVAKKNTNIKSRDLPLGETLNELIIKLPQFDPTPYFGFRDTSDLLDSSLIGKVGTGVERLVTSTNHKGLIDLKTEVGTIGYDLEFLKQMTIVNDNNIFGKSIKKVKIYSNVEGDPILEGSIVFNNGSKITPEISIEGIHRLYDILLYLEPSEYKKLLPNRHYRVYDSSNEKDVINLGVTKNGEFLNKPFSKRLKFDKALSFVTLPAFIEIYPQNLDFGKFNLHSNQSTRESSATIAVNGNNVKNFSVKITNDVDNISIYKENLDGTLDQNKSILVNNIRIEKISEEIKDSNSKANGRYINKIFKLFGTAQFDPNENLPVGNYSNNIMIEATIIN